MSDPRRIAKAVLKAESEGQSGPKMAYDIKACCDALIHEVNKTLGAERKNRQPSGSASRLVREMPRSFSCRPVHARLRSFEGYEAAALVGL